MPRRLNVLMADVSAADAERVTEALRRSGYDVGLEHTQSADEMTAAVDRQRWDLVLVSGRLEANFRQTQKLDAVARFSSGVAHDLNNLLTAILAYSESVLQQLPPDSPLREEVAEVKKSGDRASALTQRLLTFGRRRKVKAQVTNLNALITSLEPALRRMLGDHVDVVLQLAPDLMHVRIDLGAFEQVILNLVSNARDAMPAGGTLTLRTANIELAEGARCFDDSTEASAPFDTASLAPGQYVSLSISDTGFGMDVNTRAHAFEPFFTTREAGAGAGLGLAVVYGIVRQSGGTIAIETEVGRGTTMHLLLPRAQPESEAAFTQATVSTVSTASTPSATTTPSSRSPASGHETILLVEDDELVREMALLTLERRGYRVLVARDGTEAIARAHAHAGKIHLLIADLVMPRVSGQELARVLGEARRDMRVLHTIGYGDEAGAREAALANPHATFLQKPFVATALVDRVREVLSGERIGAGGHSPGWTGYSPKP